MNKILRLTAICAAMTLSAMTAFAADRPTLTIDSPQNNAKVLATAGQGDVVVIKFHTDNFKIVEMNESTTSEPTAAKTSDTTLGGATTTPTGDRSLPQSDSTGMAIATTSADQGRLRVFVDDNQWFFVHSTSNPIVLVGLAKGKHIVRLDLVGNDYQSTGVSQTVAFNVAK
jgi:hypothetical protein